MWDEEVTVYRYNIVVSLINNQNEHLTDHQYVIYNIRRALPLELDPREA